MKELVFRLKENDDLKLEIEKRVSNTNFNGGCIISAVGCVKHINIRLAKALDYINEEEDYEIISLTGTISKDGAHLHIGLSDKQGKTIGGHLKEGTIVNTTCEIVIGLLEEYELTRQLEPNTGYKELVVKETNNY